MAHRGRDMDFLTSIIKLKHLGKEGKKVGLKLNWGKTNDMRIYVRDNR